MVRVHQAAGVNDPALVVDHARESDAEVLPVEVVAEDRVVVDPVRRQVIDAIRVVVASRSSHARNDAWRRVTCLQRDRKRCRTLFPERRDSSSWCQTPLAAVLVVGALCRCLTPFAPRRRSSSWCQTPPAAVLVVGAF